MGNRLSTKRSCRSTKGSARIVKAKDITDKDVIVAIVGLAGSGKSNFVSVATQQAQENVWDKLEPSPSKDVTAIRYERHNSSDYMVLLDTPGFDHPEINDAEIVKKITDWFKNTPRGAKTRLAGLIYLHRITDNRIGPATQSALGKIKDLCGQQKMGVSPENIVFATTMWGQSDKISAEWSERERLLKEKYQEQWNGASYLRFLNTQKSALENIEMAVEGAKT